MAQESLQTSPNLPQEINTGLVSVLPFEIVTKIFGFLDDALTSDLRLTCKNFYSAIQKLRPLLIEQLFPMPRIFSQSEQKDAINVYVPEFGYTVSRWIFFVYSRTKCHLRVFDIKTQTVIKVLPHDNEISSIKSNPHCDKIIILTDRNIIYIWDIKKLALIDEQPKNPDLLYHQLEKDMIELVGQYSVGYPVVFTKQVKNLFSNSNEMYIKKYGEKADALKLTELKNYNCSRYGGYVTANGDYVFSIFKNTSASFENFFQKDEEPDAFHCLQIWDVKNRSCQTKQLQIKNYAPIDEFLVSPKGSHLVVCQAYFEKKHLKELSLYDLERNEITSRILMATNLNYTSHRLFLLSDGSIAYIAGFDNRLTNLVKEAEIHILNFPKFLLSMNFSLTDKNKTIDSNQKTNTNLKLETFEQRAYLFSSSLFSSFSSIFSKKEPEKSAESNKKDVTTTTTTTITTTTASTATIATTSTNTATTTVISGIDRFLSTVFQRNLNSPSLLPDQDNLPKTTETLRPENN